MANKFTTTEIQARFDSLPADMQQVVAGAETAERIQEIGQQHKLRIDKIGTLIEYSGLIMLGLIKTNEFVDSLSREMGISKEQAETLAIEVDEKVFSRMRESLRKVQYQSTTEKRFATPDGINGASPARDSMIQDIERHAETDPTPHPINQPIPTPQEPTGSVPDALKSAMSAADFSLSASAQAQSFSPTDPIDEPVTDTPTMPQSTDVDLPYVGDGTDISAFTEPEVSEFNRAVEIPINSPTPATTENYQSQESAVYNDVAKSVIGKMPGAVKDVYSQKLDSSTPETPPPTNHNPTVIKDFQSRLQEKLAQSDNSAQARDPYKETI